jgi:hypothetical protein
MYAISLKIWYRLRWTCAVLSFFVVPITAIAAQTGASNAISFSGKLMAVTQCKISNNAVINISFGNVGINKVDSGLYIKNINYKLDCGSATAVNTVTITFKATTSASTTSSINTSVDGLMVKILKDNKPIELNTAIKIDPQSPPKLDAQLERKPGATLTGAPFTATGTLMAEYI